MPELERLQVSTFSKMKKKHEKSKHVVVDLVFIGSPIVCGGSMFGPYFYSVSCVIVSSFAFILSGLVCGV